MPGAGEFALVPANFDSGPALPASEEIAEGVPPGGWLPGGSYENRPAHEIVISASADLLPGLALLDAHLGVPGARVVVGDPGIRADIYAGSGDLADNTRWREAAAIAGKPFLLVAPGWLPDAGWTPRQGMLQSLTIEEVPAGSPTGGPTRFEQLVAEVMAKRSDIEGSGQKSAKQVLARLAQVPAGIEADSPAASDRDGILILDQSSDDPALAREVDAPRSLAAMLDAVIDAYPEAVIEIAAPKPGLGAGVLATHARKRGLALVPHPVHPACAGRRYRKVCVFSGSAGWDFLLAGFEVHCFSMPFYAGWGLTHDREVHAARRAVSPDLPALVEAGLFCHSSYVNPVTRRRVDVETALDAVEDSARMRSKNRAIGSFYKFLAWKRPTIAGMFAPEVAGRAFFRTGSGALRAARARGKALVCWASELRSDLVRAAEAKGVKVLRMEDGFVRSVGLGASGFRPLSLVLDDIGIYYDPRAPSRLETLLNDADIGPRLVKRARHLISMLTQEAITKYNLAEPIRHLSVPAGKRIVFAPGQVEDDASILLGAPGMTGIDFLRGVRALEPDAFIVYKPHPDVSAGLRRGLASRERVLEFADLYVEDHPVLDLIARADVVHTMTSLAGFEALLRGKPVTCHGLPFYAGWGLTTDLQLQRRRARARTIEELVAATLILYPHYFDPELGIHITPEEAIERLRVYRNTPARPDSGMHARARLKLYWRRIGGWRHFPGRIRS